MKVYKLRKNKPKPARQWLKSGAGQSSVKQNTKGSGQSSYKDCDFYGKSINGVRNIALPMTKCATDVDEITTLQSSSTK